MITIFYQYGGDPLKIYKQLENGASVECKLHNAFEYKEIDILIYNTIDISIYNYAHIPSLGRYYFVSKFASTAKNVIMATLSIDVLMTYHKQICYEMTVHLGASGTPQKFSSSYDAPTDTRLTNQYKLPFENPKGSLDVAGTNILIGVSSLKE